MILVDTTIKGQFFDGEKYFDVYLRSSNYDSIQIVRVLKRKNQFVFNRYGGYKSGLINYVKHDNDLLIKDYTNYLKRG